MRYWKGIKRFKLWDTHVKIRRWKGISIGGGNIVKNRFWQQDFHYCQKNCCCPKKSWTGNTLIQLNLNVASNVNLFWKTPSLLNSNSSVAKISYSTLITICSYFFQKLFIQLLLFSIEYCMLVPLSLLAFCWIFTLSLYFSRLHTVVRCLFPLSLFGLLDVWCACLISIE